MSNSGRKPDEGERYRAILETSARLLFAIMNYGMDVFEEQILSRVQGIEDPVERLCACMRHNLLEALRGLPRGGLRAGRAAAHRGGPPSPGTEEENSAQAATVESSRSSGPRPSGPRRSSCRANRGRSPDEQTSSGSELLPLLIQPGRHAHLRSTRDELPTRGIHLVSGSQVLQSTTDLRIVQVLRDVWRVDFDLALMRRQSSESWPQATFRRCHGTQDVALGITDHDNSHIKTLLAAVHCDRYGVITDV